MSASELTPTEDDWNQQCLVSPKFQSVNENLITHIVLRLLNVKVIAHYSNV